MNIFTLGSASSKNLLLSSSRSWKATAQRVRPVASSPSSRRMSVAMAAARGSCRLSCEGGGVRVEGGREEEGKVRRVRRWQG